MTTCEDSTCDSADDPTFDGSSASDGDREERRLLTDGGEDEGEGDDEGEEADEDEATEEEEAAEEDEEEVTEAEGEEGDEEGEEDEEGGDDGEESDEEEAEDGEETAEEGGHEQTAEEVYESDEASGVLHLDLDGLYLDLLGLEVNLDEVSLDVSARSGDGNLLGNLLSQVAGLFDDGLGGLLGDGFGEMIPDLFGGDEEGEDGESRVSSAASSVRDSAENVLSELPIEELVAQLARELVSQLLGDDGSGVTDRGPLGGDEEEEGDGEADESEEDGGSDDEDGDEEDEEGEE